MLLVIVFGLEEDEDELEVLVVPLERDSTAAVSCLRFGTPGGTPPPDDEAGTTAFELVIIFLLLLGVVLAFNVEDYKNYDVHYIVLLVS